MDANQSACRMAGVPLADVIGRLFWDTPWWEHSPAGQAQLRAAVRKAAAGRKPIRFETTHAAADGSHRTVDFSITPVLDHTGAPFCLYCEADDITALQQAEAKWRREESRLQSVFKATPVGITFNIGRVMVSVNDAMCTLMRYREEDMLGRSARMFYDSDGEYARVGRALYRELPEKGQISVETRFRRGDGAEIFVVLTSALVRPEDPSAGFVVTVQDITERKQAEHARRDSESRFRIYFELGLIGMAMTSADKTIREVNGKLCEILGYARDELIGASWMQMIHAEDLAPTLERLQSVLRGDIDGYSLDKRLLRKDGQVIHAAVSVRCLRREDGTVESFLELIQDITERTRAEKEREKLQGQLRQAQKMESIGRLAGGVAHDFNNLLAPILGYTDLLLLERQLGQDVLDELMQIRKAAERARDLTRQLLAFGRKQILAVRVHDLRSVVSDFEPLLRRTIREEIAIVVKSSDGPLTVRVDAGQIQQVLMNLAVNAQDAIDGPGTITIGLKEAVLDEAYASLHHEIAQGTYASFAVSDTGCGMDRATLGRLFEPFFTTKEEGRGTGLGLSTVFGIVKQHGGHITAYSEVRMGSTFTVYLPLARDDDDGGAVPELEEESGLRGRGTILVVEDNDPVRNLTVKMLSSLGYTVMAAENAQRATALMEREGGGIDLVLTDVVMPAINGRELFRHLSRRWPRLKALYMSGYTDEVIAQQGVLDEGIHFIQKPFSVETLGRKLREVLGG